MSIVNRFTELLRSREPGKLVGEVEGRDVEFVSFVSGSRQVASVAGDSIEKLWRSQPHLRTVVDRIAHEVAALGLHVYDRKGDSRERVRSGAMADLLADPNTEQTGVEFVYALAHEIALYDTAFVLVAPDSDGRTRMRVIPSAWVSVKRDGTVVKHYRVNGVKVEPELVLAFPAWTPGSLYASTSKVEALRTILDSEQAAHSRRRDILTRGPRHGGVIQRPANAPKWTNNARKTFDEMWQAFQPGGERAGDAVLLEDGMSYVAPEFSADATGYQEGSVLSLSTVAQVFQIHPGIFGVPGTTSYQGVREVRRALIGDSLSWLIKRIEARFTQKLLPALGEPENRYVEFNVEAKLRGSFEEQATILRQAVGAPYLTVNEARALQNRPSIDSGDELIRPLNVTVEGESHRSPEDDAAQQDGIDAAKAAVVEKFKARRDQVIRSRGAGAPIDFARWDRELAQDLTQAGFDVTVTELADLNSDLKEVL